MTATAAPHLLLFSRGRGRGHAIPDLVMLGELRRLCPALRTEVASYATGASTFQAHDQAVIDLGLPEDNDFVATVTAAADVLRSRSGCLVAAHEEPAAIVAARTLGFPTLYLTHWFTGGGDLWSSSLRCADRILFLGAAGEFDEPAEARGRVSYTGPIVRTFAHVPADRGRIRSELGIPDGQCLVLVLHGSPTESTVPIAPLVLRAFDALALPDKRLVWIAGADVATVAAHAGRRLDVMVRETDWEIDRWMIACDVAVTKGTYTISIELAGLGVPSVSLSNGHNHMDDLLLCRVRSNRALWTDETSPERLARVLEACARGPRPQPDLSIAGGDGPRRAAQAILDHLPAIADDIATPQWTLAR